MSLDKEHRPPTITPNAELECLIDRLVEQTVARVERLARKPFLNSKECAELLGVTPEHLCAMRARGQGPRWSGGGKWTRYERRVAIDWLSNLPRGLDTDREGTALAAGADS